MSIHKLAAYMQRKKIEVNATLDTMAEVNPTGKPLSLPVEVVTQAKAEEADLVVCVYAGEEQEQFKADNIYAPCADCGKTITYRPHVPQKPPKVCYNCAIQRLEKDNADA